MFTFFRRWSWRFKEEEVPSSRKEKGCFGIWEEIPTQENIENHQKNEKKSKKKQKKQAVSKYVRFI